MSEPVPSIPTDSTTSLPEGFMPVRLIPRHESPLFIAVIIRTPGHKQGPGLVPLRVGSGTATYLGAICDKRSAVLRWVEIRLQEVSRLAEASIDHPNLINQAALDRSFDAQRQALADSGRLILTGAEDLCEPVVIDADKLTVRTLRDGEGEPFTVCRDDAILLQAGLPTYSGSIDRYLIGKDTAGQRLFVAVAAESPLAPGVQGLDQKFELSGPILRFNPGGGKFAITDHTPFTLRDILAMLSGQVEEHPASGNGAASQNGSPRFAGTAASSSGLFLTDRSLPLIATMERLFLKLRTAAQLVALVRERCKASRAPMLNLTAASFGFSLGPLPQPRATARGLARLWSARAELCEPSDAIALDIPGSTEAYYAAPSSRAAGLYAPSDAVVQADIVPMVIREVVPDAAGAIVRGTLQCRSKIAMGKRDLLAIKVPTGRRTVEIYGRPDRSTSGGRSDFAFVSLPLSCPKDVLAELQANITRRLPSCDYRVIPRLSTPYDLESLHVLCAECLFGGPGADLNELKQTLLDLARETGAMDNVLALDERIRAALRDHPEWLKTLGPARLSGADIEGSRLVPAPVPLWTNVLDCLLRMLSGHGEDSIAADLGDSPADNPAAVFEEPLGKLWTMMDEARRGMLQDVKADAELRAALAMVAGRAT